MIATSQPLATQAGLRAFERGGNAVDAALTAAAVLCVTEPMSTGVGGDAFAMVWRAASSSGWTRPGRRPRAPTPTSRSPSAGRARSPCPERSRAGQALSERFGRLGFDACLADAIDLAEGGYAVSPITAAAWDDTPGRSASWAAGSRAAGAQAGAEGGRPGPASRARRRRCAVSPTRAPRASIAASWRSASARPRGSRRATSPAYAPAWTSRCSPATAAYEVAELPPPTQGVAALEALALLEGLEPTLANQARCAELALEDAHARVRDGADVSDLLAAGRVARRREAVAAPAAEPGGGTVYLCAVDGDGTAVSFIQSLFGNFGAGIVAPGTGIVLQNRGACFAISGRVEPGRRPYHTIIPGMLLRDGALAGPFGVMGGFIQAQAHMQLVSGLVDGGLDPQAALDEPRFRVQDGAVYLEEGMWERAGELERAGHTVVLDRDTISFGGGQAILRTADGGLVGGSDRRKDGYAAGV